MNVAVAGATGLVGQQFLRLLDGHPEFQVTAVAAGPERTGRRFGDLPWHLAGPRPGVDELRLHDVAELADADVRVVFSALPAGAAHDLETQWADAGLAVFTNASSHRMDPDVPLLIPEVNPEDLDLVEGRRGFIVANGNCSGIIVTLPLAAIHRAFTIQEAHIVTQQARSGAGLHGVADADIHDNVLPYIRGEEEKVETEPLKTLHADFPVHATCTRVDVTDGHLAALHLRLKDAPSWDDVEQALAGFPAIDLPSAPAQPIHVRTEADRPQPRLDRDAEGGMAVSVGRIRLDGHHLRLMVLGHNTVRGAAGQSILNAELAAARGLL